MANLLVQSYDHPTSASCQNPLCSTWFGSELAGADAELVGLGNLCKGGRRTPSNFTYYYKSTDRHVYTPSAQSPTFKLRWQYTWSGVSWSLPRNPKADISIGTSHKTCAWGTNTPKE